MSKPLRRNEKKYRQMFSTKGNDKGVGMGLAISKRIIEDPGGNIRVASSSEKGTTFTVCFSKGMILN